MDNKENAIDWLMALEHAVSTMRNTDYRTKQYETSVAVVMNLCHTDYIRNALKVIENG